MTRTTILPILFILCTLTFFSSLEAEGESEKQIAVQNQFLIFPIQNSAEKRTIEITDDSGVRLYKFEITLAKNAESVDWWAFFDVSEYRGKRLNIKSDSYSSNDAVFSLIENVSEVPRREPLYEEKYRPQLRFSQAQGWNNDPNGMVFFNGEYHLFWQSNPVGLPWGNMFWGHAVSKDLVHWSELPYSLRPFGDDLPAEKRTESMAVGSCFSGSTSPAWDYVQNSKSDANFDSKVAEPTDLLAAFTDTGAGEALAVSHDGGKNWTYDSVLIRHQGRDPQLIWLAEEKCWLIAVYEEIGERRLIAFYKSFDRKNWERTGEINGFYECPNLYKLPVDGNPENTRWVLWAADAQYVVGNFDGKTFVPEHEGKYKLHFGRFYASLCFNNTPGRLIQIGWAQVGIPFEERQPFNQGFTLPLDLTLRTTPAGIRLFAEPVPEIETLRGEKREFSDRLSLENFGDGQLYDILVTFDAAQDATLQFGSNVIRWDAEKRLLNEMPLEPQNGKITFRVVVDRPMYEICANHGAAYETLSRADGGVPFTTLEFHGAGTVTVWALRSSH